MAGPSSSRDKSPVAKRPRQDRSQDTEDATGVHTATPSSVLNKYSSVPTASLERIFGGPTDNHFKLVSSAFSSATWKAMEAAWNNLLMYCKSSGQTIPMPLNQNFVNGFVDWLFSFKKLKHSSVQSYLSSIASILKLKGVDSPCLSSYTTSVLIKGGKNLEMLTDSHPMARKVMTIDLLKILGHEIALSDWSKNSKRVVWTTCCILFFGSFRVGEVLSSSKLNFSKDSCLLWEDVKFLKNSILIRIKQPKCRTDSSDFIDIFPFSEASCCPVNALVGLKNNSPSASPTSPVFTFSNGLLLTPATFNSTIRTLLSPHLGLHSQDYSSHSFRAGIPSALARYPALNDEDDIRIWGRWDSTAFKRYTRLRFDKRKEVYKRVCIALCYRSSLSPGGGGLG